MGIASQSEPREEEKWFVQTARVLAWILVSFYALLCFGRIAFVVTHAPAILVWFDQYGLQSLRQAGIFVILPFVPDVVLGIPALMLFGFVRVQTRKKESRQTSEPKLAISPFSVAPPTPQSRPETVVSAAHF